MIYIGIDPGTKTGFAVGRAKAKHFLDVSSLKIHKAMEIIQEIILENGIHNVFVRVEDARKLKLPRKLQKHQGSAQLQGVGSVKRDCSIWEDWLSDKGIKHQMIDPRSTVKKLNEKSFNIQTGWQERSNEHGRDAGMLIYNQVFQ